MFCRAESFNQPLDKWNTSNVLSMRGMFSGAKKFNRPIESWNTSGVITMRQMFLCAESFNMPLGKWDVSSVTDMGEMFYGAKTQSLLFSQSIHGIPGILTVQGMRSCIRTKESIHTEIIINSCHLL